MRTLVRRLHELRGASAIVYARSRRSCESLARTLRVHDLAAVHYHAGLEPDERSAAQEALGSALGARLAADGGAALLIDYGRDTPGPGDTLQALSRHKAVDPLASPGEADLTQWADFPAVLAAATTAGAAVTPCIGQGDFLRAMGIEVRAARLKEARPDGAALLERQMNRLIANDEMGTLFKVCAIFSPTDLTMPGFET